jgi:hypothetical protein
MTFVSCAAVEVGTHPQSRAYQEISAERAENYAQACGVDLPAIMTPAPVTAVILGEFGDEPIVNGIRKARLTKPRHDVLKALLATGDGGLGKDSLATKSGHSDASRILRRLVDSDPDWASVIQMAEVPGGRYRIRTVTTSPDISRGSASRQEKG